VNNTRRFVDEEEEEDDKQERFEHEATEVGVICEWVKGRLILHQ